MSDTTKTNDTFNKSLFNNINSANYYPIKRSFGYTLDNCDISAVIAYAKISQNKEYYKSTDRNAEFLVAGLCYNTVKQYQETVYKYTSFEEVLRRLYKNGTDSIKADIENFLKLDFNANQEYFCKKFANLSKRVIPYLYTNEIFNFAGLIRDLQHWDYNRKVKIRWATTITYTETKESEEIN